jgi:hypothetical protein
MRRAGMFKALVVIVGLLLGGQACAQTKIVLKGTPLYHVVVTPDTVKWEALPDEKAQSLRCLIAISNEAETYTWISRNDGQLFALQAGAFTNFVGSSGVVRVCSIGEIKKSFSELVAPRLTDLSVEQAEALLWNEYFLLESPRLRESPYAYVEILWKGLGVFMYFGTAEALDL